VELKLQFGIDVHKPISKSRAGFSTMANNPPLEQFPDDANVWTTKLSHRNHKALLWDDWQQSASGSLLHLINGQVHLRFTMFDGTHFAPSNLRVQQIVVGLQGDYITATPLEVHYRGSLASSV